jgi:hypothetical protein
MNLALIGRSQPFAIPNAISEGNEDVSACDRASDTQKSRLTGGMGGIRKHPDIAPKQPLDIVDRYAVPGALGAITLVPVESGNALDHPRSIAVCVYIWRHTLPPRTSP